ncbi:MAG: S-methyl-5-thioribose-1-phosphate isomerase [Alphaproteobacteria bacterium]|nr:S-methyl-5-thioribose-1-phosphate isomerase [Alphaproteobacteria bacterium]
MKIGNQPYRTIALAEDGSYARAIDQRKLPWDLAVIDIATLEDAEKAIKSMVVRGAPLIGVTAAYGFYLSLRKDASDAALKKYYNRLLATRPTAINLKWALDSMMEAVSPLAPEARAAAAMKRANEICEEDVALCRSIGQHGAEIIKKLAAAKKSEEPLNILTHCNAGWLATVDYGTALAPIYVAHDAGVKLHVWVDETRPRNQGAALTAFELAQHGVPHTVIADNAGGLLMRKGKVDMCIVGSDRVTATGDVCNKIGTYLKALAAHDNKVPFYAAFPYTTIDRALSDGDAIPIEERSASEVTTVIGLTPEGKPGAVTITTSQAANPAFDVTPARLITGYITEKGVHTKL